MSRSTIWKIASIMIIAVMFVTSCAQATPVIQTVEVPKEVIVTQEVIKEVEVTKEVIVTQEVQVVADTVTYNSYNGDPNPRAFDEARVKEWNEAHPDMPVEQSIIAHEDFKQAIRAYLTAQPSPDVLTWFAGNRERFFVDKGLV